MPEIDLSILYFFNRTLAGSAMDAVMSALTSVWWWMPVYILAGFYLIYTYRLKGVLLLLSAIVLVTFSDQIVNALIKPLIARDRPCATIDGAMVVEWIRLPIGMRHGPSFPSSHALTNMAVAVFFGMVFRSRRLLYILMGLAVLIGISRVYLGLHYPSDIVGGILIGAFFGWLFAILYGKYMPARLQAS
jgi:undecaprenyl-diphosphatase